MLQKVNSGFGDILSLRADDSFMNRFSLADLIPMCDVECILCCVSPLYLQIYYACTLHVVLFPELAAKDEIALLIM